MYTLTNKFKKNSPTDEKKPFGTAQRILTPSQHYLDKCAGCI